MFLLKGFCVLQVTRNYLFNFAFIMGPSMMPTINLTGDVFMVDRVSPRQGKLGRDDVVLVRSPGNPRKIVTKRLVGMEGDCINYLADPSKRYQRGTYGFRETTFMLPGIHDSSAPFLTVSYKAETLSGLNKGAVARASEDFMPREPTLQTLHIASVSFNSLLLGESKHDAAEFHGAARAVSGGALYVSDTPGNHDFEVLRKLVLPDGSVLRAKYAGRPTRDCLFKDPVMDGKSLLKIWNHKKLSGVVGVFNCQEAGNWPPKGASLTTDVVPGSALLSGHVSPSDIEFLEEIAGENWTRDFAVYPFNSGSLSKVPKASVDVSLGPSQCELYTISPIRVFGDNIHFAPIGLMDMYNSGGAVQSLSFSHHLQGGAVKMEVRGYGRFGAYSSTQPRCCRLNTKEFEFTFRHTNRLLIINVEENCSLKDIELV